MKKTLAIVVALLCIMTQPLTVCASDEEWICLICGEMAKGNYCSNCGTKREEDVDVDIDDEETDSSEELGWKYFDTEVTTNEGYVINLHYAFTDRWVDSYDTELVEELTEYVGIDCVDSLSSVNNLGINPNGVNTFYDEYEKGGNPHLKYIFGYLQCDNITEGWDISEENRQDVYYLIGADGDDKSLWNKSSLAGFYSDDVVQSYRVYSPKSVYLRDEGGYGYPHGSFGITLKSNQSGNLPFVLAVYSPVNPNYPDGDKWYEDVAVTVHDYNFSAYGGIWLGDTIFSSIPES